MLQSETIKRVGAHGQISLGKQFAGKQIQISKIDESTYMMQLGQFVPDSQKWLYQGDNLERFERSLQWTTTHERRDNFEEIDQMIQTLIESKR